MLYNANKRAGRYTTSARPPALFSILDQPRLDALPMAAMHWNTYLLPSGSVEGCNVTLDLLRIYNYVFAGRMARWLCWWTAEPPMPSCLLWRATYEKRRA